MEVLGYQHPAHEPKAKFDARGFDRFDKEGTMRMAVGVGLALPLFRWTGESEEMAIHP
jgi:hypothetical protein